MPTIFKLLDVSGMDKLWFDGLKPPEKLSDKHHHIVLNKERATVIWVQMSSDTNPEINMIDSQ